MSSLDRAALETMGFGALGENVLLSDRAAVYGADLIRIGNNVRIDDFCILSAGPGGILIGNNVHIGAYASLIGAGLIELADFTNLSSRVSIYSSNDDYSGASLTNPTVPEEYKNVDRRPVSIGRHVIIGSGSVVLPGTHLAEGAAVGALSLVSGRCDAFAVYAGTPAIKVKDRDRRLIDLEREFLSRRG